MEVNWKLTLIGLITMFIELREQNRQERTRVMPATFRSHLNLWVAMDLKVSIFNYAQLEVCSLEIVKIYIRLLNPFEEFFGTSILSESENSNLIPKAGLFIRQIVDHAKIKNDVIVGLENFQFRNQRIQYKIVARKKAFENRSN